MQRIKYNNSLRKYKVNFKLIIHNMINYKYMYNLIIMLRLKLR